jgi:uncharacterized membrane protein
LQLTSGNAAGLASVVVLVRATLLFTSSPVQQLLLLLPQHHDGEHASFAYVDKLLAAVHEVASTLCWQRKLLAIAYG